MAYDKKKIKSELINNIEGIEDITSFDDAALTVAPTRKTLYDWEFHKCAIINECLNKKRRGDSTKDKIKKIKELRIKKGCGYVYLIKCIETNYYKIGISKASPTNRISNLQSGCPFELEFEEIYYCKHYSLLEYEIHNRYAKYNVRGEWYEFNEAQILCVKSELREQSNKILKLF